MGPPTLYSKARHVFYCFLPLLLLPECNDQLKRTHNSVCGAGKMHAWEDTKEGKKNKDTETTSKVKRAAAEVTERRCPSVFAFSL